MHDYTTELLVPFHRDDQRRLAERLHLAAPRARRPAGARLAGLLTALAARIAPASHGAPARKIAKTGQSA